MNIDQKIVPQASVKTLEPEIKKPIVQEQVTPVKTNPEAYSTIMSDEDRYLIDRMKSQPSSIDEIMLVKHSPYKPGEHRLSLPVEFKQYEDKFVFRWLNKKKRAIDESLHKGWIVVNRVLFPDIHRKANHLFSVTGVIERGDCILAFMRKDMGLQIRKEPGKKSSALLKSQLDKGTQKLGKGQSGFYVPEDTSGDDETGSESGKALQEGRDF